MMRPVKLWLLLALLWLPLTAIADETGFYQAGVAAFKAGNYEQALRSFRQSLARGNQSPGLYYNLGVTFYKTGRYGQAADAFGHLVDDPKWAPLALYNLGLTAEADGQRQAAIGYYAKAAEAAGDSRVALLAAKKLESLSLEPEKPPVSPWYGFVSAGAGFDDNALLAPDDAVENISEEEDAFVELYAAAGRLLNGDWQDGFSLDGGLYARGYADETDYNTMVVFAGVNRNGRYDRWQTRAGLAIEADFDNSGHYATLPAVELAAQRPLADYWIRLYNFCYWIEARDPYTYLTGWENRLGAEIVRYLSNVRISAGCEIEINDRDDLDAGEEFFSYSPRRGKLSAAIDYRPARKWRFLAKGAFRISRYPEANRMINADASVTEDKREDDRLYLSVRGEYSLTDRIGLFGEYRHTDNDSNFSRYDYTTNQVLAGVTLTY